MRERAWQWANKTRRCGEIQSRRRIARALVFDVFTTKGPDKVRSGEGRGAGAGAGPWRESNLCPMRVRCRAARGSARDALSGYLAYVIGAIFRAPGPCSEDLLPYLRFARPLSPSNKVNQPVSRYYPRATVRKRGGRRGSSGGGDGGGGGGILSRV